MDPRRFQIGDTVQVMATVRAKYDGPRDESSNRVLVRETLDDQRWGRVVGLTRLHVGKYHPGHEYMGGAEWQEPEWEPPHLSTEEIVPVWLVRFGMFNRPVRVQDRDIFRLNEGGEPPPARAMRPLPLLHTNQPPVWDEKLRRLYALEAEGQPRDAKGRWKKGVWRGPTGDCL